MEAETGHGQGLERRIEAGLPARGIHKNAVDLAFLEGLDEEETDTEDLGDLEIADLLVPV